jgi:predicted membrane metal-binding protein
MAEAIPYGILATIIFWLVAFRLWVKDGPTIPLIFAGLWVVIYLTLPRLRLPIPFDLVVCAMAIVLLLLDRGKSQHNPFAP